MSAFRVLVKNPIKESFYGKKKKIKVMFGNSFFFYFQKLFFGNIKKINK